MTFELSGKLIEKFDTVNVTDSFRKREFVIETTDNGGSSQFTEQIKFQLTRDKCELLDNFGMNDNLRVFFNIRGRRWEKEGKVSYFTNLEAWKIDRVGGTQADDAPLPDEPTAFGIDEDDEVPF